MCSVLEGDHLLESLLLYFRMDDRLATFEMTLADVENVYRFNEAGDRYCLRGFLRLTFEGVSDFERALGESQGLHGYVDSYDAKCERFAVVVQWCRRERGVDGFRMSFHFGVSFGDVCFDFKTCEVSKRYGLGSEVAPNAWEYRDADSGEVFEFYRPFGDG